MVHSLVTEVPLCGKGECCVRGYNVIVTDLDGEGKEHVCGVVSECEHIHYAYAWVKVCVVVYTAHTHVVCTMSEFNDVLYVNVCVIQLELTYCKCEE